MMLYPNSVITATVSAAATATQAAAAELQVSPELSDRGREQPRAVSGTVRLRSSDPTTPPVIDLRFFDDPADRDRLADGIHRAIALGDDEPVGRPPRQTDPPTDEALATPAALDAWLDRNVMTGHHVSSTCRIGRADDPGAVVDASGRVHGIESLRIVDASIMPDSVRANIHATVLALAEVMAGRIRAGT